jgi:hypothetical protein
VADVFLSYKREDRGRAKGIAQALEAHGYSVFYDAEIDVGEAWNTRIENEMKNAKCVAVLWSEHSVDTGHGEWVHNEARIGKKRGILAPALIASCDIPLEFSGVQAAELTAWRGDPADPQWQDFVERVGVCVKQPPRNLPGRPWRKRWVRWAAALLVVAAIGVGVWKFAPWPQQAAVEPDGPGGVVAEPVRRVPSELAEQSLGAEWTGYLRNNNCPAMLSWSTQYSTEYPDWELARVARDQTRRLCPTTTPTETVVPDQAPAPEANLLARLRSNTPAPLTDEQIASGATRLGISPAALRAIMFVQSGRATGFGEGGRPNINFEHHVFSRLTGNRFDGRASGVSSRDFVPGTYARPQGQRWQLLEEAYGLDANAALSATGWGRFRILGMNYEACGFRNLEDFVLAQSQSEESQLRAFEAFVTSQNMVGALRAPVNWNDFAQRFYGSRRFASELDAAYRRFGGT